MKTECCFVADGIWKEDPGAKRTTPNPSEVELQFSR